LLNPCFGNFLFGLTDFCAGHPASVSFSCSQAVKDLKAILKLSSSKNCALTSSCPPFVCFNTFLMLLKASLRLAYCGSKNGKFMYTGLNVACFFAIASYFCGKFKIFLIFFCFFREQTPFLRFRAGKSARDRARACTG